MGGALVADDNWRHAPSSTNYTQTRAHAFSPGHINMDRSPRFLCNKHRTYLVLMKAVGKIGCLHALSQAIPSIALCYECVRGEAQIHVNTALGEGSWLRHYATSPKVTGSIPDEVTGFLN
jgi:hypothetical protein